MFALIRFIRHPPNRILCYKGLMADFVFFLLSGERKIMNIHIFAYACFYVLSYKFKHVHILTHVHVSTIHACAHTHAHKQCTHSRSYTQKHTQTYT